jgi:Cu-Zn family superoxide dismutase
MVILSSNAMATIQGGALAPRLDGFVFFEDCPGGTRVTVEVCGLPHYQPGQDNQSPIGPHGFHIHEFGVCDGDFSSAGGHWNPTGQPHGNHAGDFPVLFSNHGYSWMSFFTDKFKPVDAIGKAVIIHESPDDYRTQPAGNSGRRLGCGVIRGC